MLRYSISFFLGPSWFIINLQDCGVNLCFRKASPYTATQFTGTARLEEVLEVP